MTRTLRLLAAVLLLTLPALAQHGTLQRAEKMTPAEQKQLADAKAKVQEAEAAEKVVEAQIAAAHSMDESDWMEFATWYEFDGEFVLQRYENHMILGSIVMGK